MIRPSAAWVSFHAHVANSLYCPRVMAAPENIKAGFLKEKDIFSEQGIKYVAPLVCLAEPALVPKQIHQTLKEAIPDLTLAETRQAVRVGYAARSIRSFAGTGARFSSGARAMTGPAS